MANKRTPRKVERKATKKTVATRTPRTTRRVAVEETPQTRTPHFMDYFRLSESYTSLILGIVVVIITSLLLIAFLRNRTAVTPQSTKDISTAMKVGPTISLEEGRSNAAVNETTETVSKVATPTLAPTNTPAPTVAPTTIPTKAAAKQNIYPATKQPETKPTTVTTVAQTRPGQKIHQTVYVTKAGDDLWAIAERFYKSGYNWVDIANANDISNPDVIYSGTKLVIPGVEKKIATVTTAPTQTAMSNLKGGQSHPRTYTVKHGDDLWDVAVAVYNDGYRWSDIAKANNLANPNVIHSGNVLKIP